MELDDLTRVIDGLAARDPDCLADAESVVALHRQLARLDALATQATAHFDTHRDWAADGARSAAGWITARCHLPARLARREIRLGRALPDLPEFAAAWADGDITADHLDTIVAVRSPATRDALARDETLLATQARELPFRQFAQLVTYWEQLADPDGTEDKAQARHDRRDVTLAESFEGMWLGKITLDPISGTAVAGELGRLEKQLFEAEWAETRERLGREPTLADLPRSPGQRRADALVEMAARSATAPAGGTRPAPRFTVLIDYDTLIGRVCELANGTPVAPGQLVPWLSTAEVERAVFGPSGRVEVSERARFFTGATRRAIQIRDTLVHHGCAHPYCDEPPERCQVDHIIPHHAGGPTTQANGRLLCGHHNRQRHQHPPPAD